MSEFEDKFNLFSAMLPKGRGKNKEMHIGIDERYEEERRYIVSVWSSESEDDDPTSDYRIDEVIEGAIEEMKRHAEENEYEIFEDY